MILKKSGRVRFSASCVAVWALLVLAACEPAPKRASGPMRVAVTIAPLAGLVAPLLPEGSSIEILIPPGLSPHGAELTPSALALAAKADLVVGVGFGLDSGALRAARHQNDGPRVVLFEDLMGAEPADQEGHDHGRAGRGHAVGDPHAWLDPALCERLVVRLAETLEPRASDAAALRADRDRVIEALRDIDRRYSEALEPHAATGFVTHHDAWRRLTDRYGLRVVGVIRPIEAGEPTPGAIADAVEAVRTSNARLIVIEPQFDPGAARRVAELTGAPVATLDPIGDGDWFAMMNANLEALVSALGADDAEG